MANGITIPLSIQTLPQPTNTGTTGDVDHLYCCDPNIAYCGLDLSDVPECPEGYESSDMCPLCVLVDESGGCPECGS